MPMRDPNIPPFQDPEAKLELALIEEFLHEHGSDLTALAFLAPEERQRLLHDASAYAANRLAEIWARAHYVGDLHKH
jgi:hypothetical protein